MVNNICERLPLVLINYIYFLSKILYIQDTLRTNRPLLGFPIIKGSRVLLLYKENGIIIKRWGTIDKLSNGQGWSYLYRIRLISPWGGPTRLYWKPLSPNWGSPRKIILMENWRDTIWAEKHSNGYLCI